jgi:NhaP-type Na+/H+ or K+/H+ antiporter
MPREYVMRELEQLLGLFVAAVILAAAARGVGAPYPVFLALGGALLAFFPGAPALTVPLELALALFVAPVLLDAAYDTSLRDLRDNWLPVTSLGYWSSGKPFSLCVRTTRSAKTPFI